MLRHLTRAAGLIAALLALAAALPTPPAEAAAVCRTFQPTSEVAWYLSEDEPMVDFYPSGTEAIEPYFEYSCAPRNTTVVTIFTLNGEEIHTDEEVLQPSGAGAIYSYPLAAKQGPVPEGEWGVTFLVNDQPVVAGAITVGGEPSEPQVSDEVQVGGTVTDKRTRKPIRGAMFVVLQPGVTVQQFADDDFADEHVLVSATTDARGEFVLDLPLERGVEYSIVVAARGYKPVAQDGFVVEEGDEDPLQLNVTMVK